MHLPEHREIPRARRSVVPRPRVMTLLSDIVDYPLTVVKAGAGYGKTTALGAFARSLELPVAWLTVTADEQDPTLFIARMMDTFLPQISATERQGVWEAANHPLSWDASAQLFTSLSQQHMREDSVCILDDFHLVQDVSAILRWLDLWLRRLPDTVHVVLISRTEPALAAYQEHSLRGDLLLLRERDLQFTGDEVSFLFQASPDDPVSGLDRAELDWLQEHTGGMPMIVTLLWRRWQQRQQFPLLKRALTQSDSVREQVGTLFLSDLSEGERDFFTQASILTSLSPPLCDALLGRSDSATVLSACEKKGFLVAMDEPDTYTVHPLVREHLQSMLSVARRRELIWRVVNWHQAQGQQARAIQYLFALDDEAAVIDELQVHIPHYLAQGQVATVQGWLERISAAQADAWPALLWARGEVARLGNHYAEARRLYETSCERAQELGDVRSQVLAQIGLARLFLDTIQPSLARAAIRDAQRRSRDGGAEVRLTILQLAFENAINLGHTRRANRLGHVLGALASAPALENNSDARLLLRTGRIHEAIQLLESRVGVDQMDRRTSLSHREATLLLSLLYSLAGDALAAREQALRSFTVGDTLHSPFVQAVGYIRLGHALHLFDPLMSQVMQAYDQAMGLMEALHIARGQSEALMGQSLAHAYQRQFELARACAERGIAIAERVEDTWMANLVRLAYGQGCCVNRMYDEAHEALSRAATAFQSTGDPYLTCAALLWRALSFAAQGSPEAHEMFARTVDLARRHDCEEMLYRPTYFGLRDRAQLLPLYEAYKRTRVSLGHTAGFPAVWPGGQQGQSVPGYTLRVQTLGGFRVWRGAHEVSRREWQREKARQLFQYFLTKRSTWVHREEITEALWGERDPETAERDFKVALSTLLQVLEPDRRGRGGAGNVFVAREGSTYQLVDHAHLDVDSDRFMRFADQAEHSPIRAARMQALWAATQTYQGDYLEEARYSDWADAAREHYRRRFLRTAVEYATVCLQQQGEMEAIRMCERALQIEPTWEAAYLPLMRAYGHLRNRTMVAQTYRNCKRVLEQEYGLDVSDETTAVYREWTGATRQE
ncbi:MAG: BTAD domain-containing putative transcriptional regulator [Firmicutes bacterium]|nr:BTAD domain-containing putative transcriptional regulator [Bacillota bacterium]